MAAIHRPLVSGAVGDCRSRGFRPGLSTSAPTLAGAVIGHRSRFIMVHLAHFPHLLFTLNEAADITRLLIYPLPQRELIAAVLLGTLFDYPTYLMLPMLLAVLVGWGASLALPVVVIAILLSYAHMIFIGLLVGTALGGVLQSRRFRDVAIIFTALLGSSCYFIQVGLGRLVENMTQTMSQEALLALQPLPVLQWFPTGAAAQAIAQAADGQWVTALGWLLYSSTWLLLIVWAWWKLLIRLTTGEGFIFALAPRPQTKSRTAQARATSLPIWLRRLPPDIAHIMSQGIQRGLAHATAARGTYPGLAGACLYGWFYFVSQRS